MTEQFETPTEATVPAGVPEPPTVASPPAQDATTSDGSSAAALVSDRPELAVGAAFAGGFLLATLLKRLAR